MERRRSLNIFNGKNRRGILNVKNIYIYNNKIIRALHLDMPMINGIPVVKALNKQKRDA